MGTRLKDTLSLRDIEKIKTLFDEQNWIIEDEDRSVFSKFCIRAKNLPETRRNNTGLFKYNFLFWLIAVC